MYFVLSFDYASRTVVTKNNADLGKWYLMPYNYFSSVFVHVVSLKICMFGQS